MYSIPTRYYANKQPPAGRLVDCAHPLARPREAGKRGLHGGWVINTGQGAVVQDVSPDANHGGLSEMDPAEDWVAGTHHGWSLDFNGSDDRVVMQAINAIYPPCSFVVWVYLNANNATQWFLASCMYPASTTYAGMALGLQSQGRLWFNAGTNGGGTSAHRRGAFATTVVNPKNEWHMVTGICRAVTTNQADWDLYINDAPQAFTFDGNATTVGYNANVGRTCIGNWNVTRWLNGKCALAYMFDYALTPEDVQWLYREPYCMFPRPRSYWYGESAAPPAGSSIAAIHYYYRRLRCA